MKHTPGPWNVSESVGGTLQPFDAKGRHLLSCEAEKPLSLGVRHANAALIAAAPELLEALEYVVQWHRDHDSGEGELFGLDYVTTCIGAIRKAKGG